MKIRPPILIIDACKDSIDFLSTSLYSVDAEIYHVHSEKEALTTSRQTEFALVLCNLHIHNCNVFELIKQLHSVELNKSVPMLLFSNKIMDDDTTVKVIESGGVDILQFPINQKVLLGKLNIFLNYFYQKKNLEKEMTDKKELEKRYETSLNDLKKANSLKSNFLSTVSHEIRTPLNAILGVAEVLGETPIDEEQEEYVSMLQKAGDNLLILINDILDFSKIEAGEMVLEESSFHLSDLVDETISLLSVKAVENNITLQYQMEMNLPMHLYGDSYRLKQILVNLVGNAIKFTPRGKIHVLVSDISSQHGITGKDRAIIEFSVQDNGIGISKEDQKTIFNSFTQIHSSRSKKHTGTGLGLAICKKLISIMGGSITVKSELNQGSTFTFQIPLQIQTKENSYFFDIPFQSSNPECQKSQKYLIDLKNTRVLLIENNTEESEKIKDILSDFEMNVIDVDSVKKARSVLLNKSPFNIVIVDIVLPIGGDGFDFIREFQKSLHLNEKCIVILPENHRKTDVSLIKQLGISSYFKKPINENKMLVAISKVKGMKDKVKKIEDLFDDSSKFYHNKSLNILIAEDSEHNQALLKVFFKKYPFNLDICGNGKEAVSMFTKTRSKYDLILMDLQMPVMDGYEAVKKIRNFENINNRSPLPIIAFTASVLKEDIKRAMEAGCNSHISKPVKKKKLLNTISKYFNLSEDSPSKEKK